MTYNASHFHGRSTRKGTSWTDQYICPTCKAVINRPSNLFKGKPKPVCVGGRIIDDEW